MYIDVLCFVFKLKQNCISVPLIATSEKFHLTKLKFLMYLFLIKSPLLLKYLKICHKWN